MPNYWRCGNSGTSESRKPSFPWSFGRDFCTVLHIFPQGFSENPLAKFSERSYYAHRLIGKKNFTSQFREGGEGKTEPVPIELN
jgi:hypothetical protein